MWNKSLGFCFAIVCCLVTSMPGPLVAEQAVPALPAEAAGQAETADEPRLTLREQRLQTHLETLDRTVRQRQLGFGPQGANGDGGGVDAQAEQFLRHLRTLEGQVRSWKSPHTDRWLVALRALRDRVQQGASAAATEPDKLTERPLLVPVEVGHAVGNKAVPVNDACVDAMAVSNGSFVGDTSMATNDGAASCGFTEFSSDVWFRYSLPIDGTIFVDTIGSDFDTVLSIHQGCPGNVSNEIRCDDNSAGSLQSSLEFFATAGFEYYVRVAGFGDAIGSYTLNIGPGGAITGRVTDAVTGDPLPFVEVEARRQDGFFSRSSTTGVNGDYTIGNLETGSYAVFITNAGTYLRELYDNQPCTLFGGCDFSQATEVVVQQGAVATGIDFGLELGGSITGRVTDNASGEPIVDAQVVLASGGVGTEQFVSTDDDGRYTLNGLSAGSFMAYTVATGFRSELYDDLPCPAGLPFGCDISTGTSIPVSPGQATDDIDFALDRLGSISGTVTEQVSGSPLAFYNIEVWDASGSQVVFGQTDMQGDYQVGGLAAGTYFVSTRGFEGYQEELFDNIPCPGGAFAGCDPVTGTGVAVSLDNTTPEINFALERQGSITGRVIDASSQQPIPFVSVNVFDASGDFLGGNNTDASGNYRIEDLNAGIHFVTVFTGDYANELYDDIPCGVDCDPTSGTPVLVALDATTPGIDFALRRQGSISGTVTNAATGEPIWSASVIVREENSLESRQVATDTDGNFMIDGLATGSYLVTADHGQYFGERYDNIPCDLDRCEVGVGTRVMVSLETNTDGIDFALEKLGSISGRVTLAGVGDLTNASVLARDAEGFIAGTGQVLSTGEYTVASLPPGTYRAFATHPDYLPELFDDILCPTRFCDRVSGTPIDVNLDADTGNIDFVLDFPGVISGRVTDSATGEPLSADVLIHDADGELFDVARVGDFGEYSTGNLVPGTYFARIAILNDYVEELYNNIPCPELNCDPTTGTPIVVTHGSTITGIDFALDPQIFGAISGRVRDAFTGQPIDAGNVQLWDAAGNFYQGYGLDGEGRFNDDRVAPGTYYASSRAPFGYRDELYDNLPCPNRPPTGCDPTTGTPIVVAPGGFVTGIDFELTPVSATCTPSDTELCLSNGRFRVEATWEDQQMTTGDGQSVALTDDTGYFWFFDDSNVELVVKVLDACVDPFNRFWVFAGGLTDVAVELTVTDTVSGEVKTYNNALGSAFEPITDTDAFATCPAGRSAEVGRVGQEGLDPLIVLPPKTLALNNGRFTVDAVWATSSGESETADSVTLTDDTGYFWFFDADNVEVVVKVLDACALPGFNSYWVFAAGLTDVEVALTVTDTVSGEVQEYFNPLGSPFQPIQDTAAFGTCDAMRP